MPPEYGEWAVFAPMAYDGVGMSVAAHIHLLEGLPLSDLDRIMVAGKPRVRSG